MLQWLPEDVSTFGHEIGSLFYLIYYITGAAFILVTVLMLLFLLMESIYCTSPQLILAILKAHTDQLMIKN